MSKHRFSSFFLGCLLVSGFLSLLIPIEAYGTLTGSGTRTVYSYSYNSTSADGNQYNSSTTYATALAASEGLLQVTQNYVRFGQRKLSSTYYCYASHVFFTGVVVPPPNAVILYTRLCLYGNGTYFSDPAVDFNITVRISNGTYPHNPIVIGDYNNSLYTGDYGYFDTVNWAVNAWNNISILSSLFSQSNVTLSLFSSRQLNGTAPTGNEILDFCSGEHTYPARLEISYYIDATRSSSERILRDPYQRKTCEVGNRTFVLMNNDTAGYIHLVSTDNFSYWLDPIYIGACGGEYSERSALFFDGTYIHIAWYNGDPAFDTWYKRCRPYENGTVDMDSDCLIWNGTGDFACFMPSICVSTDGYAYVAAQQNIAAAPYTQVVLWKNSLTNGSWTTAWEYNCTDYSGLSKAGRSTIVQLPNGKMGFLVSMINSYVGFYLWNGSSWTIENQVVSNHTSQHADFVTAVNVGEEIHFAYCASGAGYPVYYKKRDSSGTWESDEVSICNGSSGTIGVELTNYKDECLLLFWANTTTNTILKRLRWITDAWGDEATVGTAEGPLTNLRTLQSPYYCNTTVKLAYQVNTTAPFYLRMMDAGTVPVHFIATLYFSLGISQATQYMKALASTNTFSFGLFQTTEYVKNLVTSNSFQIGSVTATLSAAEYMKHLIATNSFVIGISPVHYTVFDLTLPYWLNFTIQQTLRILSSGAFTKALNINVFNNVRLPTSLSLVKVISVTAFTGIYSHSIGVNMTPFLSLPETVAPFNPGNPLLLVLGIMVFGILAIAAMFQRKR